MWLYILLTLAGLLLTCIGTLGILGSRLPETHVVSATVDLQVSPDVAWASINDMQSFPGWVPAITKMERLPDDKGRQVWRQHMGHNSFVTTNDIFEPPTATSNGRVLRTILDEHGPFSGSWDHVIEAIPGSLIQTRLTLTETGTVKSAIPRAMMRYMMGEDYYVKKFLGAVKIKLG